MLSSMQSSQHQYDSSYHPGGIVQLQSTSIANTNAYNTIEDTAMDNSGSQS